MPMGTQASRILLRDALLGLLVLALVFLNFGHHPALAHDGYGTDNTSSWCGEPVVPADLSHSPCHACRIGDAGR
ncbi:MAG: hypothetical protein ABL879_08890 [Devosia sp.]